MLLMRSLSEVRATESEEEKETDHRWSMLTNERSGPPEPINNKY